MYRQAKNLTPKLWIRHEGKAKEIVRVEHNMDIVIVQFKQLGGMLVVDHMERISCI